MKTVIVIPARYASTQHPGKPLVMLKNRAGVKLGRCDCGAQTYALFRADRAVGLVGVPQPCSTVWGVRFFPPRRSLWLPPRRLGTVCKLVRGTLGVS